MTILILLQAAIAAGFIFFCIIGISTIVGTVVLVHFLMRGYWKLSGKNKLLETRSPFYKDPVAYFICLILSVIISLFFSYQILLFIFRGIEL